MLLVKLPVPVPFVVWLPETNGLDDVLQHTPLAVIAAPPSLLILPPLKAANAVIDVTDEVVNVAKIIVVVKLT